LKQGNISTPAAAQPNYNDIDNLRRDYWANGFRPVPITNREKFPRGVNEWEVLARHDPPDVLTRRPQPWALGTGILCDGLRVVDVDIDNDPAAICSIAEYCLDHFGTAPTRFRDNADRILLMYAAPDGEMPPKASCKNRASGAGVEILGYGNQFFAAGMHPSGAILQWFDGPEITDRRSLGIIDQAAMVKLLDHCAELIGADRKSYGDGTRNGNAGTNAAPLVFGDAGETPINDIIAALDAIPNLGRDRALWWSIGAAVYVASGGSHEGYEAWRNWSAPVSNPNRNTVPETWRRLGTSPTDSISAAKLFWHASENDPAFQKPSTTIFNRISFFKKP
jgi:hypothetical protein